MLKLDGKLLHSAIVQLINTFAHCPDCAKDAAINVVADLVTTSGSRVESDKVLQVMIGGIQKAVDFKLADGKPADGIGAPMGHA